MAKSKSKSDPATSKKSKPKKSPKSRVRVRREGDTVIVSVPVKFYRRNGRQMVLAETNEPESTSEFLVEANAALIAAIARAYQWQEQLESGEFESLEDLANNYGVNRGYVSRILQLTSLSPKIVDQILSGRNSTQLTLRQLRKGIAINWHDQFIV